MGTHRIGPSERVIGLCTHRKTTKSLLLVSVLRAHMWARLPSPDGSVDSAGGAWLSGQKWGARRRGAHAAQGAADSREERKARSGDAATTLCSTHARSSTHGSQPLRGLPMGRAS